VTRLAVLGSPIAHSKSPLLHAAAYRELGLDWRYDAVDVSEAHLREFVASRDESWRGLSLTMPLKREVLPLLQWADDTASLTRAANTVLFDRSSGALELRGYNTDVYGVTAAFREAGVDRLDTVEILGGGATAASALAAASELGASLAIISVRTPAKAVDLATLGERLGVEVAVRQFGALDRPFVIPDAVVSTIPGHGSHGLSFAQPIRASSVLFDVAYDPWPSELAADWIAAGGTVISGLEMLLHQAVAQIRIFVNGAPDVALPGESDVLAAMRAAVSV
jgi:shikimate dehydrogenase